MNTEDSTIDSKRKTDLAFKLLDNVQALIKFADTKINVLLVISGVTTSFVLTNFQTLFTSSIFAKISLVLFFIVFLAFVILAIFTISPRRDKHTGKAVAKIVYFGHVASRVQVADFISDFEQLNEKCFLDDVLYQVYENSKIADKKFKFYKFSLFALQAQLSIFFVLLLLKLI